MAVVVFVSTLFRSFRALCGMCPCVGVQTNGLHEHRTRVCGVITTYRPKSEVAGRLS